MPNFPNPFSGNVDRKMTNAELMQALRIDIAGDGACECGQTRCATFKAR